VIAHPALETGVALVRAEPFPRVIEAASVDAIGAIEWVMAVLSTSTEFMPRPCLTV
jgi:hypothetical protein